ncbi:MAG: tail assembly protein, partial [Pseudomonadota bacterium]
MAFGVGLAGASMALGGVVQMLSPQAKGLSTKDSPNNGASYNFNGPVNTTAQGNPVPILYGRMIVGSAVLSGGIFAEDQA